jgi:hypothetical protein
MTEQTLDRPAVALPAAGDGGTSLAQSEAQALIPGWRCLPGALIRAYGEEGPVDLAALHPARGVALIAFLEDGQVASPEEARDALQVMLRDEGLPRRFPGELPIVALPVPHHARARLAATVEQAFTGLPAPTLPPGWVDWVAEQLDKRSEVVPALRLVAPRRDEPTPDKILSALLLTSVTEPAATAAAPRLIAPQRDEDAAAKAPSSIVLTAPIRAAPTPEMAATDSAIAVPVEALPPPAEMDLKRSWLDWGATLGFALGMGAALIAGFAAVLRNGRLF